MPGAAVLPIFDWDAAALLKFKNNTPEKSVCLLYVPEE
jgi:hypothetical protein